MQNDAELDKERERGRTHFPALKEQISVSDHRWFVQFLHKGAGAKCFFANLYRCGEYREDRSLCASPAEYIINRVCKVTQTDRHTQCYYHCSSVHTYRNILQGFAKLFATCELFR